MTATNAATRIAAASRTRRLSPSSGPAALIAAAASSGTATTSASNWSTRGLSLQRSQLLRIQGAEPLVRLDREGQQERGDGGLHHDVGKGERLDDGVDRWRVYRHVEVIGRHRAGHVADAQQQHVRRGLDDDQADDLVNEMTAGHDAVEADGQDPRHDDEREILHQRSPCRIRSVCSSSSPTIRMKAAATSRPTKKLISAMVPDELTAPAYCPSGRTLVRSSWSWPGPAAGRWAGPPRRP